MTDLNYKKPVQCVGFIDPFNDSPLNDLKVKVDGTDPTGRLVQGPYKPICSWVVSKIFYFHPYLGKIPILTNIFQLSWFNHQLGVATVPSIFFQKNLGPFLTSKAGTDGSVEQERKRLLVFMESWVVFSFFLDGSRSSFFGIILKSCNFMFFFSKTKLLFSNVKCNCHLFFVEPFFSTEQ